jgi:GNAT superfamily N-acetyltransferase
VFPVADDRTIRMSRPGDWPALWPIWHRIVAAGRTYLWSPDTGPAEAERLWMLPPPAEVWVVEDADQRLVGTGVLKPNQPGLGAHVAHAAFMVDPHLAGRGIGRVLAEHILDRARERGFEAMQFNAVVADNPAVQLWLSLGFDVVGRVPDGMRRPDGPSVDLLVMHRRL